MVLAPILRVGFVIKPGYWYDVALMPDLSSSCVSTALSAVFMVCIAVNGAACHFLQ
jgi:hypothetical protein